MFLILQGIAFVLFLGQFSVEFPKILDVLGAVVMGFMIGMLVWSFVVILISGLPIGESDFAQSLGFSGTGQHKTDSYLVWWCDRVDTLVSTQPGSENSAKAVEQLREDLKLGSRKKRKPPADSNAPPDTETTPAVANK